MILLIIAFLLIAYISYCLHCSHREGIADQDRVGHWIWLFYSMIWNLVLLMFIPIQLMMEVVISIMGWITKELMMVYDTTILSLNKVTLIFAGKYYGKKFVLEEESVDFHQNDDD